jgi:DNA polymerase-1
MKGLYLVDAMALAYRSFFALMSARLRGPQGEPVSAVYGFAQALLRVAETREPSHFAVARDLKGPTFRHEMYEAYKAQRQPMPDDLVTQLPMLDALVAACGLPLLSKERHEADDVMATYAVMGKAAALPVYLMTRDKDLMQLVGDGVCLYDPGRGSERPEEIGPEWVMGKLGVRPDQVRDYLTLVGDASDNIPGVAKIGPKTAVDLLTEFDNLDNIYANIDSIARKAVRGYLMDGRENADLSRRLVSLVTDLDVPPLEALEYRGLNLDGIEEFLLSHGIKALLPAVYKLRGNGATAPVMVGLGVGKAFDLFGGSELDVPAPPVTRPKVVAPNLQPVVDESDLEAVCVQVKSCKRLAIAPLRGKDGLTGLGLAVAPGIVRYVPLSGGLALDRIMTDLWPCLEEKSPVVLWGAKLESRRLRHDGIRFSHPCEDAELAAYLLAPGERNNTLETLSERLGIALVDEASLVGTGKTKRDVGQLTQDEALRLCGTRADALLRVWNHLSERLETESLTGIYRDLELPLSRVLGEMEEAGIALDTGLFKQLSQELGQDMARLDARAQELAGHEFNISSPKQLGTILFEELSLPHGKKTSTGAWSTDAEVLEVLAASHELPRVVLEHRELAKLKGTYTDVLPTLCDEYERVHTTFDQTVAATGRLSSIDPNLQNIPVRGEIGRRIRHGFVARPGHLLLSADYSQIELRLLAHLSGDQALLEVYRNGLDIHAQTASRVHGVPPEEVSADQRRFAKVINFGVVYGMGAHALSGQLGISHAQAKTFIEGYFAAYPRVKPWMDEMLDEARKTGFVQTVLGRKRWVRGLNDKNRAFRESSERMAVNTPVQGSAADLVKLAMLAVDAWIFESGVSVRQLLQVHDELVMEVREDQAQECAVQVKRLMEGAMTLSVPLLVEVGIARDWGAAH